MLDNDSSNYISSLALEQPQFSTDISSQIDSYTVFLTVTGVERLIEPLKQTCAAKVKSNSVKQEYEKQDELKRSALRAVMALQRVPGSDRNQQLNDFLAHIKSNSELSALYDSVEKSDGSSSMMGAGESRMMEM